MDRSAGEFSSSKRSSRAKWKRKETDRRTCRRDVLPRKGTRLCDALSEARAKVTYARWRGRIGGTGSRNFPSKPTEKQFRCLPSFSTGFNGNMSERWMKNDFDEAGSFAICENAGCSIWSNHAARFMYLYINYDFMFKTWNANNLGMKETYVILLCNLICAPVFKGFRRPNCL